MADENQNKKSIFREKSIERIESPEKLNDYLRVTSPAVWIVLVTVIVLLVGVCVWGALGHIDSTVQAAVVSDGDSAICLVPQEALEGVVEYRTLTVDDKQLELAPSVLEPQAVSQDTDVYVLLAGNLSYGDVVYPVDVVSAEDGTEALSEGVYSGKVLIEKVSPMSLFFN